MNEDNPYASPQAGLTSGRTLSEVLEPVMKILIFLIVVFPGGVIYGIAFLTLIPQGRVNEAELDRLFSFSVGFHFFAWLFFLIMGLMSYIAEAVFSYLDKRKFRRN